MIDPIQVSVVIPTWNRVEYLGKVFEGLHAQSRKPNEVIIGVRREDTTTLEWLDQRKEQYLSELKVNIVLLDTPGVVASMQAGVDASKGDVVCLLDDDAKPYPDWIETIVAYFESDDRLGAVGGRDILAYLESDEVDQHLDRRVGFFTWYGKFYANHHCGTGDFRYVHVLKGCNCSFRGELIREIGFDQVLAGWDTQTHWETALCLDILNRGFRIGYVPTLRVLHYVAPRHGPDQNYRGGYSAEGIYHQSHNLAYVIHSRRSWPVFVDLYTLLVGTKVAPGIIQWVRLKLMKDPNANSRLCSNYNGYFAGIKTARSPKRSNASDS